MEPKLQPRRFKIEHDANEYNYFVELIVWQKGTKWGINLGTIDTCLSERGLFDYPGNDTMAFDTPEEALEGWKKYVAG